jgi:predicted membrane protein
MPIVIGVIFLINKILPDEHLGRFFWPLLIIGFGAWMISGRKEKTPFEFFEWDKEKNGGFNTNSDSNEAQTAFETANFLGDRINSVSIFGGIKKNIVSKNFQGGDIVNFFGGSEINLMQADIKGRVKIEVVQVFGGTKIIVPANWIVQSEMLAIFGGIEDKRPPQLNTIPDKILIIEGTSIFGGIDIKSF